MLITVCQDFAGLQRAVFKQWGFQGFFSPSTDCLKLSPGRLVLGTVGLGGSGSEVYANQFRISWCVPCEALWPPRKRRVDGASVTLNPVLSEPEFLFSVAEWVVFGKVSTSGHTLWRL